MALSGVLGCASTTVRAHSAATQQAAANYSSDRSAAVLRGDRARSELRASDPSLDRTSLDAISAEPTATVREPHFAGPTPQIPIPTGGGRAGIPSMY